MEESILIDIKKLLNISIDDKSFDQDILIHINSTFTILNQLGVGKNDFIVKDGTIKWSDFLIDNKDLSLVRSYVYLKVKMMFDPPVNSSILQSYNSLISEYEWRLNSQVDYIDKEI